MIGKIDVNSYEQYPKIAKVFKEIGLVDELGSGVRNLYKYTKIYSRRIPELNENDIFRTIIPISGEYVKKSDNYKNVGINKTQKEILSLITKNINITEEEISKALGRTKRTIERNINILKNKNIIERVGFNKIDHWKINL